MTASVPTSAKSGLLDIQGQNPGLHKLYTQICSIYEVSDPSSHDAIVSTLRNGLRKLAENFPWLAGHVINEGARDGDTGTFRIVTSDEIPLVVKDLRSDTSAPTLDGLRKANFPMSMLHETLITPCLTLNLPGNTFGLVVDTAPVFAVQANFIADGLILAIVGQHNVMDMTGQNHIMNWLSKACYNQSFDKEELEVGNMDRSAAIPLLNDDDSVDIEAEIAHQMVKPAPETSDAPSNPPSCTWAYISFPAISLEALKSWATKTMTLSSGFVSTDDSVSAFIWKCVSRARRARLEPDGKSLFARAVDVRAPLGTSSKYTGVFMSMAYAWEKLERLDTQSLGEIASQLRRELDPRAIAKNVCALATFNSRSPDKTKTSITARVNASSDIMLSSWAKIDCFDLDFNLGLGKPEAVRRPAFLPVESLMYILPKSPKGEMPVAVCLRDEDWERLKSDSEFVNYATFIG